MAYSKTSPGQIAAQLAAGAALFGTLYYTFYKKEAALPSDPTPPVLGATPQAQTGSPASQAELVAALDREAQNTAGKRWAAQRKASGGGKQ
jgi:hypothetical protein